VNEIGLFCDTLFLDQIQRPAAPRRKEVFIPPARNGCHGRKHKQVGCQDDLGNVIGSAAITKGDIIANTDDIGTMVCGCSFFSILPPALDQ